MKKTLMLCYLDGKCFVCVCLLYLLAQCALPCKSLYLSWQLFQSATKWAPKLRLWSHSCKMFSVNCNYLILLQSVLYNLVNRWLSETEQHKALLMCSYNLMALNWKNTQLEDLWHFCMSKDIHQRTLCILTLYLNSRVGFAL